MIAPFNTRIENDLLVGYIQIIVAYELNKLVLLQC